MNVFEDLIEELKDENLLEDSIFDMSGNSSGTAPDGVGETAAEPDGFAMPPLQETDAANAGVEIASDDTEFYRKLAMDEVSSLQMVGHVFAGVEREQMKSVVSSYDDLEAKKALHRFLQVTGGPDSDEHLAAKKELLDETEAWNSALALRDENITVANLRRFCENSRPVLSSQALIALARFYRNAAFSELARSKFDYVMTRLFSRDAGEDKRRLLFGRVEMVGHINTLYANWSSLSVYSAPEYADLVREQVTGLSNFAAQAEAAASLDELLGSNVFESIRQSKEDLADMFYAPEITAAAIDCNLRIGNKFIEAVWAERNKTEADAIEEKYGYTHDQIVSTAAGRTLQLLEILRAAPEPNEVVETERKPQVVENYEKAPRAEDGSRGLFSVNKWLLLATVIISAISIGMYLWAENYQSTQTVKKLATDVNVTGTPIEKYVRNAKQTAETLYCVTNVAWEGIDEKAQKEVLVAAMTVAAEKGSSKVHFVNAQGRTVGYATKDMAQIYEY
jgi:hypothetical protein